MYIAYVLIRKVSSASSVSDQLVNEAQHLAAEVLSYGEKENEYGSENECWWGDCWM